MSYIGDFAMDERIGGLGIRRYIRLLMTRPRFAFEAMTRDERGQTALAVYVAYFIVTYPIMLGSQWPGNIAAFPWSPVFAFTSLAGAVVSFVFGAIFFMILGLFLHVLLNWILGAGKKYEDAAMLPMLALAPQLFLVLEWPLVFLNGGDYRIGTVVLMFRLVVGFMSAGVFFRGLVDVFGLSRGAALFITLLPLALAAAAFLGLIALLGLVLVF